MLAKLSGLTAVALAASTVFAQTHTECDPTKRRDCKNPKALGATKIDIDWRQGKKADNFFYEFDGTKLSYDKELGAVYNIEKDTDAPTTGSHEYIFFGRVDVELRAAPGKGIVSSLVFQSDDLDEIDWEWLGYKPNEVQTNYFSKGCNRTYDRGGIHTIDDATGVFHTYSIDWTPESLKWIINGNVIRELKAADVANKDCGQYPQSPMQIRLGSWIGGRKSAEPGTIEWAGGLANFADGPFPSYYKSIKIVDYQGGRGKNAKEYHYTDLSGSADSIKIIEHDGKDDEPTTKTTKTTSKSTSSPTGSVTPSPSGSGTPGGNNGTTTDPTASPTTTPSGTSPAPNLNSGSDKVLGSLMTVAAAALLSALFL